MTEEDLRELAGVTRWAQIEFAGHAFALREDGLAALLRFARATTTDNPEAPVDLSAIYRLISDCVTDFPAFEHAAMESRAGMREVAELIPQLVRFYTARSHWPAMRLIGFLSGNLEELDGQLIKAGGAGIAHLSAREACDFALAACLEGRSEDDREAFLEDLNYEGDAESDALSRLREYQAQLKAAKAAAEEAGDG